MRHSSKLLLPVILTSIFPLQLHAEQSIEEVNVIGNSESNQLELMEENRLTVDTGDMLTRLAGANINRNGALTSIAQYRGMYGDRINVNIDGQPITSGGPNAMDAPLHYAPGPTVESLTVYRGLAPVSVAQQAIGGAVIVNTHQGKFSDTDQWQLNGRASAAYGTAANSEDYYVLASVADNHQRFSLNALAQQGDDYRFPAGEVSPSVYERDRYGAAYAYQRAGHFLSLDYMKNKTGDAGTPALPMDIAYVDSEFVHGMYRFSLNNWEMKLTLGQSDVEHKMTNYHLRTAPANAMQYRSTLATGQADDLGIVLKQNTAQGFWLAGIDFHNETHDADITNPNNSMFYVTNFNQAENEILGGFVEMQQQLSTRLVLDAGLRFNQVTANAGEVDLFTPPMISPAAVTLRNNFNQAEREQSDDNIDAVIKLTTKLDSNLSLYSAIGQKTRSASYQERYLWMPMQSTGGLADGFNYIGDIELSPEVAREIELGLDWQNHQFWLSPRVFYRDVSDYIQGTPTDNMAAIMLSNMMGNTNPPMQFTNVDAKFYGVDMPWYFTAHEQIRFHGAVSAVRAERKDINDNIYRVSPDNARVAVDLSQDKLTTTFEMHSFAKQNRVAKTNAEQETAGYTVFNLMLNYAVSPAFSLAGGIDNLTNKNYQQHLAGVNRAMDSDVAVGDRLPGVGRNSYIRLNWQF